MYEKIHSISLNAALDIICRDIFGIFKIGLTKVNALDYAYQLHSFCIILVRSL